MQLSTSEISELIKSRLENFSASAEARTQGTVISVTDGIVRIHGLSNAMAGEMIEFPGNTFGMALNLVTVLANRGTMPVRLSAMHGAGRIDAVQANSTAMSHPTLPWLVDRWAAPDWIPLANVFSVGDVVIALGAVVIVLAGMGVRIPRVPARSDARI